MKHVRIAPQDEVTLTYKPKCFSMPDLLQVDTFRDTNHKHPKIQLGTHQHLGPVDMRGRLRVPLVVVFNDNHAVEIYLLSMIKSIPFCSFHFLAFFFRIDTGGSIFYIVKIAKIG